MLLSFYLMINENFLNLSQTFNEVIFARTTGLYQRKDSPIWTRPETVLSHTNLSFDRMRMEREWILENSGMKTGRGRVVWVVLLSLDNGTLDHSKGNM